jgi:hypothetical protein
VEWKFSAADDLRDLAADWEADVINISAIIPLARNLSVNEARRVVLQHTLPGPS